ncbi:peptide deformylase [Caulobacter phage Cr30]|uniref:peptide deformylase n=1 Tax=Caulobacter phage Cr30 TaxID=1357714 RepID=UPI0004A9BADD|nr:peptide deformylase [Caulobacter phage Cr30]AGS81031.1 peptide deformylase [Caulobacter phage Cr30]
MFGKTLLDKVEFDPESIHTPSQKFDFHNSPCDPIEFARFLSAKMITEKAIGLAAPQIGINLQVIAIQSNPVIVMFNPKIIDASYETLITLEEGCVSFPGIFTEVERPRRIKVRYTEPNGNVVTKKFEDFTARVIQHEIDHLNGITMIDKTTGLKGQLLKKRIAKVKKRMK